MNVAIQIGGELRNWETSYGLFSTYKEICKSRGIELEFFGCFWESEYVTHCKTHKLFDLFTALSILPVPTHGTTEGHKKQMIDNNTGRSTNLYNWSYACYISTKIRREYQWSMKPFGFKYDFVIYTRPDVYAPTRYWDALEKYLEKTTILKFPYTLFTPPILKTLIETEGVPAWPHCVGEDLKMSGDEDGMNIFAFGILPLYIDNNPSFVATYHNTPCLTISKFNLGIIPTPEQFMNWQILRINDCERVDGSTNIEPKYIDSLKDIKLFLEKNRFKYDN